MLHRKLTIVVLVFLLIAGISVSACAPDTFNNNAQGIAQAILAPSWEQANSNGFGDPQTLEVSALAAFNTYLYAGTTNPIAGARIFRSQDGATWTPVTQPGFGISHDIAPPSILDLEIFNGRLYASTGRGDGPGQIWRTVDGVNWAPMVIHGFGNPDTVDITALAVYNNMIYAAAINQISGAQIWRSFSGDSNTWTQVAPAVAVPATNITGFTVFNSALYAAVESNAPARLWRSTGGAWTTVVSNGFGDSLTTSTGGMAIFGGYLCVGAGNSAVGAQLWCSSDGGSWAQVINPGFGDPNNQKIEAVFVFQNQLYVSVKNAVTGMEIWRSADSTGWEQVNQDGFGDSNNSGTNGSNATAEFLNQLYVGTSNLIEGGELWRMLQQPPDTPTASQTQTSTNTPTNTATDTPTLTPTNTATDTPTNTPTNTLTNTPTVTHTPTDTPINTLTNTPTDTPTDTPTNTPVITPTETPTNTPTDTPTNTPTDTPTSTPMPISNTPGKVNGGGVIGSDNGGNQITFGFTVDYNQGDVAPNGNLTYQDHKMNLRLKATSFELLVIQGNHVWLTGTGIVNDGLNVKFEVQSDALSQLGQPDTFYVYIPAMNGYAAGGALTGGNLTIHK